MSSPSTAPSPPYEHHWVPIAFSITSAACWFLIITTTIPVICREGACTMSAELNLRRPNRTEKYITGDSIIGVLCSVTYAIGRWLRLLLQNAISVRCRYRTIAAGDAECDVMTDVSHTATQLNSLLNPRPLAVYRREAVVHSWLQTSTSIPRTSRRQIFCGRFAKISKIMHGSHLKHKTQITAFF